MDKGVFDRVMEWYRGLLEQIDPAGVEFSGADDELSEAA